MKINFRPGKKNQFALVDESGKVIATAPRRKTLVEKIKELQGSGTGPKKSKSKRRK